MSIKSVLVVTSVLFVLTAFSQELPMETDVMEQIIRFKQNATKIYYNDSLLDFSHFDKKAFRKKKFVSRHAFLKGNHITLTAAERKYIITEFKKMRAKVWQQNLFSNSQRVPYDSTFAQLSFFLREDLQNQQSLYRSVWRFAKPVFLRNNTICLIAYIYMIHSSGGEEELAFYKKYKDGRWRRFIIISGAAY